MFRCEADTKDGGVCLHTLRNGECPNWANHAPSTSWSIDSALWQIVHGEKNSDKTNNASEYLHEMVDSPNSGIVDEADKEFARDLMGAISDLRDKIDELEERLVYAANPDDE